MSSGQLPGTSKSANVAHQPAPPSYSQTSSSSAPDGGSQRRTGGSGSFGSGNQSAPRNIQPRKNQHKRHRRPHLVDDDAIAETAAMKSTTSRKGQTSITHLMNFSLPPRPQHHRHHPHHPFHRPGRRNPTWGLGSGYHAIDKARYVHANYRFIVNPQNNYFAQAANADVHLDWETVLQVLVSAETQSASCPICLSTPVAPRMAKCGHIFCLPCLIRFMHSTDDTQPTPEKKARWKKCPICWDSIYISETRPVRWFTGQQTGLPMEGGDTVLRLVTRRPGSTLALPRDGAESLGAHEDIPWYHAAEVSEYARIMKGGEDYMASQYDAEIADLRVQEREDELMFGDDTTWSHRAVTAINEAKGKIIGIGNPPNQPTRQPAEERPPRRPITFQSPAEGVPEMYAFQHAVKSGQSSSTGSTTPGYSAPPSANVSTVKVDAEGLSSAISGLEIDLAQSSGTNEHASKPGLPNSIGKQVDTNGPPSSEQTFYFYQALPHFYLSSLDIRILKAAFGDYSHFPSTILPRIERISTGHIVDDDLRKRAKYLGHLPYGCEVSFLECDWTDLVGPEVLGRFKVEIDRRRKRNREKEAREDKERIRAEKEEEDKRWAAARRKRPSIGSIPTEQPFSQNDFQPLSSNSHPNVEPSQFQLNDSAASPPRSSSGFGVLASPSTSPSAPRTVWGTVIAPSTDPEQTPTHHTNARDDGWLQGWEKELDDSEVAAQIAAMGEGSSTPATGGGKKKKKNKITLMSTGARRGA
ncbi:hypothetical protein FQN54_005878 [Arachnomyces sp. PD_36]|nr:hypothetical protein FQN54_005878 [Arachnomyces sp. PD_36]